MKIIIPHCGTKAITTVFGIELDTDVITNMPVSAYNTCGVSVDTAANYVHTCALQQRSKYIHICEASPCQHPNGVIHGICVAGQIQTTLVTTFMQAKLCIYVYNVYRL